MIHFIKKTVIVFVGLSIFLLGGSSVFAAGNIDTIQKYSQFIDADLDNDGTDDFINWSPTNGGATITDDDLSGYIWGETVGWINLSPNTAGVTNTCDGELGGMAWGENTGWINFSPTNPTIAPNINTSTGLIIGQVWSQNYGWIELASPDGGNPGLVTTWRPSPSCDNPPPPPPPPVGGSTSTLKVIKKVSGGISVPSDFILSIKQNGVDAVTPFLGSDQGIVLTVNTSTAKTFTVSELPSTEYGAVFSGDCPAGVVTFPQGFQGQKVCTVTNVFGAQNKYACKDTLALNYSSDPQALAKNSLCIYEQSNYGCKDPDASNYVSDPQVITRNSLCKYVTNKYACKDTLALNYSSDPQALAKNSLCIYEQSNYGCKDPDASNYVSDPQVISDVTQCNYPLKSYACKDPTARNYNADVQMFPDNRLCEYGGSLSGWWNTFIALLGLGSVIPWIIVRSAIILITISWDRRKILGVVYDSVSKEPLDPVFVSVINNETNSEVTSQFTDIEGRFAFTLNKGHYHITSQKTHYQYPSERLAGRKSDEVYDHLYFGQPFEVKNEKKVVTMNIPMDPLEKDWNQEEKHRKSFMHFLIKGQTRLAWIFDALFVLGFVISIIITYFYPVWWNYVMTSLYVLVALLRVYGYGAIYAGTITRNGQPLANVMVRVWDPEMTREVAHKTTNNAGAYYVLVAPGAYRVTIEEKGVEGVPIKVYTSGVIHTKVGVITQPIKL